MLQAGKPAVLRHGAWSKNWFRFFMLLPTFVILVVFMFYPILEAFRDTQSGDRLDDG